MKNIAHLVDRALANLLIGLMTLLVLSVVWQVISRYLLGDPNTYTEELARYLLVWLSLLGGAYGYRQRMHMGLSLLTEKLRGGARRFAEIFALLAAAIFSVTILIGGGSRLVWITWELQQHSAAMNIPMAWVYSVLPISGVLMFFYTLLAAIEFLPEHASAPLGELSAEEAI
jgi:TRAP-type C4-dicarboxylate transport system permease small subunit